MSTHKALSKKKRLMVYEKYDHHCAYCGCELIYGEMQVDHIKSVYQHQDIRQDMTEEEMNDIDNLMPSCRACNFYKGAGDIEFLRKRLEKTLVSNLEKTFDYRLAAKYGLVKTHKKFVTFYFETYKKPETPVKIDKYGNKHHEIYDLLQNKEIDYRLYRAIEGAISYKSYKVGGRGDSCSPHVDRRS